MRYLILIAAVILALLLATFSIQNPIPVQVRYLGFQTGGVPLYVIILLSTLIGILLAGLLSLPGRIQRQLELRRLRQQTAQLEKEVAELKARLPQPVMRPLSDEPTR